MTARMTCVPDLPPFATIDADGDFFCFLLAVAARLNRFLITFHVNGGGGEIWFCVSLLFPSLPHAVRVP